MAETKLNFDEEILQNKGNTYSSLTELNKVPLFTIDFKETVAYVNQKEIQNQQYVMSQIFVNKMKEEQMDSVIVQMMFQQDTQRTIKKEQVMTEQTDTWLYPFTGCAFGIFFAVLIGYCKKKNRRLKKIKIEDMYE